MSDAMFALDRSGGTEVFRPQPRAASQWADAGTVRGLASSALMARFAERSVASSIHLRPVRWTADLSRPIAMDAVTVRAEIVRSGRRLCLVDVEMEQDDRVVARGRGLFLATGTDGSGEVWAPRRDLAVPPPTLAPETPEARLYYSDKLGWTGTAAPHRNAARKQVWCYPISVVDGEQATPFQWAAGVADLASVVTAWGSTGVEFINADITMSLARLPVGPGLGVSASDRMAADGIAVGTALLHDREGVVGTATVSALHNGATPVDPGARDVGVRR